VEIPLDFAPENYLVTILNGTTPIRQISAATPVVTYTAAEQTTDFGSSLPAFGFSVQQVSAVYGAGAGHGATGAFSP